MNHRRARILPLLAVCIVHVAAAAGQDDLERGRAWYTTCVGCHGTNAAGNYGMRSPNLTTLDRDYVLRQLRNFRNEVRGGIEDFYGWQMNGRAKALRGNSAVEDVVAYIDSLPDVQAPGTIDGDVKRGQEIYANLCAVCHGERGEGGEGIPEQSGSRLSGIDDWYQFQQLRNFRDGIRGAAEDDEAGQLMRPVLASLEGDQVLRDVVAYIATLTLPRDMAE